MVCSAEIKNLVRNSIRVGFDRAPGGVMIVVPFKLFVDPGDQTLGLTWLADFML